jgi:hypothetical protein
MAKAAPKVGAKANRDLEEGSKGLFFGIVSLASAVAISEGGFILVAYDIKSEIQL